jgi:proton-translocating NADH-quinone oxidoreductase chain N
MPFSDNLSSSLIDPSPLFSSNLAKALLYNDLKCLLPEVFLLAGGVLLLLYGVIVSTSEKEPSGSAVQGYPLLLSNMIWLGQLVLGLSLLLLCRGGGIDAVVCYNTLLISNFTLFLKGLVLLGTWAALLLSLEYIKQENSSQFEYVVLVLLSCSSMLFLISSQDLISIYLGIELQSLSFYVLAGCKRDSEFSTEAGLKYFLLGAFSSGILLFGASLIYGFTGSTNLSELAQLLSSRVYEGGSDLTSEALSLRGCLLGLTFLMVGLLFKCTAVPFHMWVPDVYEGAPTSVTAFLALAPKLSVLALLTRLLYESFYDLISSWQSLLLLSSIASMSLGALAAMSQNKIKRLLAYSSIGHVGYMLGGICCATVEGVQGLILYQVVYLVMTGILFGVVLSPLRPDPNHQVERVKYNTDLALLSKTNPLLALTLTVTLFSMAGIPPLAGFYSKAYLFFAALASNLYFLALIGVLASVISCFYYIRIIKIMYFETPQKIQTFSRLSRGTSYLLGGGLLFLLLLLLYPSPLYLGTHKAALALCG